MNSLSVINIAGYTFFFGSIRLFSVLRAHINHLNVKVIYTDFELAAMNSFQNQFPGVRLQACFFHLAQSVYRKVQENHDLRQRYDTDKDFSVLVSLRTFVALEYILTQRSCLRISR
uniref:MULE transposase domain-containing protein n=1 Tax=Ixodes ricinus TaxID=34613 RepID=A0A6B0ULB9_IXORI